VLKILINETSLNFKLEKTNNDTYLKKNNISGKIVDNKNILENSLGFNFYSNDLSITFETSVYENLDEKSNNDRYEYTIPNIQLTKNLNNFGDLNGDLNFRSQSLIRNYNTNVYERKIINDFDFNSYPIITSKGFYNNYKFLIKNANINNRNSNYKNHRNIYLSSIFQYNSSLPLIQENDNYRKIFKPKVSFMVAPPHTKNNKSDTKIDITNVFSIDRFSNDTIEGGGSIIYGGEYSLFDKSKSDQILNVEFANNLRFDENDDIDTVNQMNDKVSNFFGGVTYKVNKYLTASYNSSIKNNFEDIVNEDLNIQFKVNNFITEFDYLNDNTNLKNSYLTNKSTLIIDKSNSLSFSTRENKTTDLTEYYNLMYKYQNDCLIASLEYNKDYYNDRELKPNESLLFKLSIVPFNKNNNR